MTNKLPEIGKRYRDIQENRRIVEFIGTYRDGKDLNLVCVEYYLDHKDRQINKPNSAFFCSSCDFWLYLEELPDQEPSKTKTPKHQHPGENAVWWADEDLRVEDDCPNEEAAVNWSMKEEDRTKKSIWKPISELPEAGTTNILPEEHVFIRWKIHNRHIVKAAQVFQGKFYSIADKKHEYKVVEEFCSLEDFFDQQKKLEERITKLEQLTKKK